MTLSLLTHRERTALFGVFNFTREGTEANPERVRISSDWVRANLVEVPTPELYAIGGPTKVTLNYRVAESFQAMLRAWADAEVMPFTFNGTWAQRFKRQRGTVKQRLEKCRRLGQVSLSNHAWGTAADFDAPLYPLGKPAPKGPNHDRVRERARIAELRGWAWGGAFEKRCDAMHFEATAKAVK